MSTVRVVGLPLGTKERDVLLFMGIQEQVDVTETGRPKISLLPNDRKLDNRACEISFKQDIFAQNCVDRFNKSKMNGKTLKIVIVNKKATAAEVDVDVDPCSVHITGLPSDVTPLTVHNYFKQRVSGVSLFPNGTPMAVPLSRTHKQAVFKVTFNTPRLAQNCVQLSGENFNGFVGENKIRITLFKQKKGPAAAPKPLSEPIVVVRATQKPHTTVRNVVFFQGITKTATDADIIGVMERCGDVKRVVIYRYDDGKSQGRGLVSFGKPASAARCLENFNGRAFPGGNTPMILSLFQSTKIRRLESRKGDKTFDNSEPGFAYECVICFETWDSRDMMGCVPIGFTHADQEAHFSCMDCVAGHARSLVVDGKLAEGGCGIPCATNACKRVLLRAPVLKLLDRNSITQLEKRMDNIALMNVKGFESCKYCDFGAIFEVSPRRMQFFSCKNPRCLAQFCRICKIDFTVHAGKQCSDVEPGLRGDRERKRYEEELSEAVIRKCKNCNTPYQKISGCNKMTCENCGTKQCYLCRASGIGYEHFREGACQLFEEFEARDQAALDQIHRNARNNRDLEPGPVQIEKGTVIHKQWKILRKLGEGGCGAVYKVRDLTNNELAALKAESNFVAGGSVLKLEVQILNRLSKRRHVARMLHCGKKETYSYMVMTLLGESLGNLLKKFGRVSSVSTQMRVGINVLFGIKQIHDIGFVHRDLKPANIAIGRSCTDEHRFLHILDFGLAREYVMMDEQGQPRMRRPRERALFRGTTRYCSINTHERAEQGRADDLWSLLYLLAEMRGPLPWSQTRDKKEVHEIKKRTEFDVMLENCPVQLIDFATHLNSLDYFHRPDYALLFSLLNKVMTDGGMRFSDPWDWERPEVLQEQSGHKKDDGEVVVKPLKMDERTARQMDKAFTIDDFSEDVFGF